MAGMNRRGLAALVLLLAASPFACSGAPSGAGGSPIADAGTPNDGGGVSVASDSSSTDAGEDGGNDAGPTLACAQADAGATDDTTIAVGLENPAALTVVGNTLYWVQNPSSNPSSIMSVPVTGGTPTTLVTLFEIDGSLASDGTYLYFSGSTGPAGQGTTAILKVPLSVSNDLDASSGLDAAGEPDASSGFDAASDAGAASVSIVTTDVLTQQSFSANQLYFVDGSLYVTGMDSSLVEGIFRVTPSGTTTMLDVPMGNVVWLGLQWADTSGLYYLVDLAGIDVPDELFVAPLAGGAATDLGAFFIQSADDIGQGIAVVGGNFYVFGYGQLSRYSASAPGDGGLGADVVNAPGAGADALVADANGLYVAVTNPGCAPAIYYVPLAGGAPVLVHADATVAGYSQLTLDATHVYWVTNMFNGAPSTLHAKAR